MRDTSEWVRSLVSRLRREGWRERWGRGGHIVFDVKGRMVTVPYDCCEGKTITRHAIERKVGWT